MKKKRKAWSEEARKNHLEGCRRYQEWNRKMKFVEGVFSTAERECVDPVDLCSSLIEMTEREDAIKITKESKQYFFDCLRANKGNINAKTLIDTVDAMGQ